MINFSDDLLFGSESADKEDDDVFYEYAVSRTEVDDFLSEKKKIRIIRAYKGEGKSGLLKLVKIALTKNPKEICIFREGSSISLDIDQKADHNELVRSWKKAILREVACEVGSKIGFAFSDDSISLVEEAERNGYKEKSFVLSVFDRLKSSAVPLERKQTDIASHENLLRRNLDEKSLVWFLIDDIDQNFDGSDAYIKRLTSFFAAIVSISKLIPSLRFRLTLRPNVLAYLEIHESLSHIREDIVDIRWDVIGFEEILARRIKAHIIRSRNRYLLNGLSTDHREFNHSLVNMAFDSQIEWRGVPRRPEVVLCTLSRHRPRWLIELCKESGKRALDRGKQKISKTEIIDAMNDFGRRRLSDLIAEFKVQCPQLEGLVSSFSGMVDKYSTTDLVNTVAKINKSINPKIAGIIGNPNARQVSKFLFEVGFISAFKMREKPEADGKFRYDHFSYYDRPQLLGSATASDKEYEWEIHPVFRNILNIKSSENF